MLSNNLQFFFILTIVFVTLLAVIALIIIQVQIIVKIKKAEKKIKQHPLVSQFLNSSTSENNKQNLIQNLITSSPFVQSLIKKTIFGDNSS